MNNYEVYIITNLITDKKYVGITKRGFEKRLKVHFYEASVNKYDMYLHNSIRKYGKENFVSELLYDNLSHDKACELEVEVISSLNTLQPHGYNQHVGGKGGCKNASLQLREKLSKARLGKEPWNKGLSKLEMEEKRKIPKQIINKTIKIVVEKEKIVKVKSLKTIKEKSNKIPWNKGMKMSQEYKDKVSSSCNGRVAWNKGRRDLPPSWNKGMKFPFKARKIKKIENA